MNRLFLNNYIYVFILFAVSMSAKGQVENHLDFFGIKIVGDKQNFMKKLNKGFNEGDWTISQEGNETFFKLAEAEDDTIYCKIYPLYNSSGTMYGVTMITKQTWRSFDTFTGMINNYVQRKYQYKYMKYFYGSDDIMMIADYILKDNSNILIYAERGNDAYINIKVCFIDSINAAKSGIKTLPEYKWSQILSAIVPDVEEMYIGRNSEEMQIEIKKNNQKYYYFVRGNDRKIIDDLLTTKYPVATARTLLMAYNNMAIKKSTEENRKNKLYNIYYDEYASIIRDVQEEQKRKQSSMTNKEQMKNFLFQYMKHLIFTKQERDNMDYFLTEDVQKALFSIVGNIALPDSKYQFMGISFSSEEEMRRYKYEEGYDPYY